MRNKIKYYTFLLICLTAMSLTAQDGIGKVVIGNSDSGDAVMVKWVVPPLIADEGFKVYRKENAGEWVLQNAELIKRTDKIEIPAGERDDAIDALEDMIENDEFSADDNMSSLILIVKFVESNAIARWLGLFYNDKNVVAGNSYQYKVTEMQKGVEVPVGISRSIVSGVHQPIAGLENPSAKMNPKYEKEFRFSWTSEEDRYFGVNAYRKSGEKNFFKENKNIILPSKIPNKNGEMVYPDFFYNTSSHNYGIEYTYQLRPVDFFGREGLPSQGFKFIIIDKTPVPSPYDVAAVRMNSEQVLITWAAPDTDKVKGYNVLFGSDTEGEFTRINEKLLSPSATELVFNVPDWGDYYFRVEAVNSVDIPSPSGLAAVSVLDNIPPVAVTGFTAEGSEGMISLKWNANPETDLLGYILFRSVKGDDDHYERITTQPMTATTYSNKLDKRYKNEFYYKVVAIDTSYNMGAFSERASAKMPDVTPPEVPTVIKVELTETGNVVQWFPSLGDDLKGYEVYRCSGEDMTQCVLISKEIITPNFNEYLDLTAEKGTNVGYKVLAEDLAGNRSATSNLFIVKTKKDETEGTATARMKVNYNARQKETIVKWNKPQLAEAKGTMVYRKIGEGRYVPISGLIKIEEEYRDKKVTVGNTYTYQVRTYYKNGTVAKSEAASAEVK